MLDEQMYFDYLMLGFTAKEAFEKTKNTKLEVFKDTPVYSFIKTQPQKTEEIHG